MPLSKTYKMPILTPEIAKSLFEDKCNFEINDLYEFTRKPMIGRIVNNNYLFAMGGGFDSKTIIVHKSQLQEIANAINEALKVMKDD